MKTILTLAALLCAALPAAAQSAKVYTNDDLGKRTVAWSRTVTDQELAGLKAREFVYVPTRPAEARVVILRDTPWFPPFAATSEPTRPLSEPWSMTTYLGHGPGHRGGGHRAPTGPGIHLVYGR
jgi:hypothetical protein